MAVPKFTKTLKKGQFLVAKANEDYKPQGRRSVMQLRSVTACSGREFVNYEFRVVPAGFEAEIEQNEMLVWEIRDKGSEVDGKGAKDAPKKSRKEKTEGAFIPEQGKGK